MIKKPALIGIIVVVAVVIAVAVILGVVFGLKKKPSGPTVTWYSPSTVWSQWGTPSQGESMGPYVISMNGDTGNVWTSSGEVGGTITVEPLTDLTNTLQHFYLFQAPGQGSWGSVTPAFIGTTQGQVISIQEPSPYEVILTDMNSASPYPFLAAASTSTNPGCKGLFLMGNSAPNSSDCCYYLQNLGQNQVGSSVMFVSAVGSTPTSQQCQSFSTISMGYVNLN